MSIHNLYFEQKYKSYEYQCFFGLKFFYFLEVKFLYIF